MEYGSARWGTHEDIAPYIDPVFQNNEILTKTESLTMNSRPKDPKKMCIRDSPRGAWGRVQGGPGRQILGGVTRGAGVAFAGGT